MMVKQLFLKKMNESNLITITFYLEDDNHKEVIFGGGTLTFSLQLVKIYFHTQ